MSQTKILIFLTFIILLFSCSQKSTPVTPLDFKIKPTAEEGLIILLSDKVDTAIINKQITLEKLDYDIKYSIYNLADWCKAIKFSPNTPDYLFVSIMAALSVNSNNNDCYILNTNNTDNQHAYILRYTKPDFRIKDSEYYYGKFYNGKTFVIDLLALIDTDINKCSYYYNDTPFNKDFTTFLNGAYFKTGYLNQISSRPADDSVLVSRHK